MVKTEEVLGGWSGKIPASQLLARFVTETAWQTLPPDIQDGTRLRLLDTIGLCLVASVEPFGRAVIKVASRQGVRAEATVVGDRQRVSARSAALVNGTLAHGLDFDDTYLAAVVHPSSAVIPTALAVGEANGASPTEVLSAIAAGCEVMSRLGAAAGRQFHARGFHASGCLGPIASALVAARLFRLGVREAVHAAGLAGSFAGGLLEFLADGSWSKRVHLGWAAQAGVVAAELAQEGFTGPATVLEGRYGLYHSYLDSEKVSWETLSSDLGTRWESRAAAFKLYPCAHAIHPFLEAALRLRSQNRLNPSQVESIECVVPEWSFPLFCVPWPGKVSPGTEYQARASIPFAVAAALVDGAVGLDTFTPDGIKRSEILAMARRVTCSAADTKEAGAFSATVRVAVKGGQTHVARSEHGPESVTGEKIVAKFLRNASRRLSRKRALQVHEAVLHFEDHSLSDLLSLCRV